MCDALFEQTETCLFIASLQENQVRRIFSQLMNYASYKQLKKYNFHHNMQHL
jgi:hypothetical protein